MRYLPCGAPGYNIECSQAAALVSVLCSLLTAKVKFTEDNMVIPD